MDSDNKHTGSHSCSGLCVCVSEHAPVGGFPPLLRMRCMADGPAALSVTPTNLPYFASAQALRAMSYDIVSLVVQNYDHDKVDLHVWTTVYA